MNNTVTEVMEITQIVACAFKPEDIIYTTSLLSRGCTFAIAEQPIKGVGQDFLAGLKAVIQSFSS